MTKKFDRWLGWFMVSLGVLGFFGNSILGNGPGSLFLADSALNVVHIVSGIILLTVIRRSQEKKIMTLRVFAGAYILVAILGLSSPGSVLGLVMTNTATDYMHLILGLMFLWLGMLKPKVPTGALPMGTM